MCPVWLLVAVAVVGVANGSATQCFEHPSCQEGNSESSLMDCILLCRAELTGDTPLPPLSLLSPPASSSSSSQQQQTKRSYSMEHFRWGKPVGRKRRPIKVYTSNGVEEESAEVFPGEMRRRELPSDLIVSEEEEKDQDEEPEVEHLSDDNDHEKKDGTYKMKHFRWGGPPASKRYGGFMKSWDEQQSQRPLLTLFKNVINKEGPQQ